MANRYSPEIQTTFQDINNALQEYVTTHASPEILPTAATQIFIDHGLVPRDETSKFNQQRIRYNRWAELNAENFMLNWKQKYDAEVGQYKNIYDGLNIVEVEQYGRERAKERFSRILDFSQRRHLEMGDQVKRGDYRGQSKLIMSAAFQISGVMSKMQRMAFMGDAIRALDTEEIGVLKDLTARASGANAMIEANADLGTDTDILEVLNLMGVTESMDRLLGLPDPSNGEDE